MHKRLRERVPTNCRPLTYEGDMEGQRGRKEGFVFKKAQVKKNKATEGEGVNENVGEFRNKPTQYNTSKRDEKKVVKQLERQMQRY